jgi:TonB-dependent starch-binding outer membrane protein SusC
VAALLAAAALGLSSSLGAQAPVDSVRRPSDAADTIPPSNDFRIGQSPAPHVLLDMLSSLAPGLLIVRGAGVTGMGSRIRLRGVQSLVADRAPIVFVDGMRVDLGEDSFWPVAPFDAGFVPFPRPPGPLRLDDLNPSDVDSIEVITSSASAALYGPGANAGVLLIHTRRGRPGPLRLQAYAQGGISSASRDWPANFGGVDSDNASGFFQQGGCTLRYQAQGQCVQDFVQQFNPLEQRNPLRTALLREAGLSVAGGSARADYRVSGQFTSETGPYSGRVTSTDPNNHRRINGRLSLRVRPGSTVEFGVNATRISGHLNIPPNLPYQVGVSGPSDSSGFDWSRMFRAQDTQDVDRLMAIFEAKWSPWRWMGVRALAGFDAAHQLDARLSPYVPNDPQPVGSWTQGDTKTRHRTLELAATATNPISSGVRSILRIGVQALRDSIEQHWTIRTDFGNGFSDPFNNARQMTRYNSTGYYADERFEIGRRLVLGAAVRHDRFKGLDRHATYPGLSATWLAHLAAESALVSQLRFRAAYGSAAPIPYGGLPFILVPIGTPVPRIDPERTTSADLGADATFLKGRAAAQLTYYAMHSRVLSVVQTQAGPVPFTGMISNRGVEAMFSGQVLSGPGAGWDVTLSLWGNRNRLKKFSGPPVTFGAPVYSVHLLVPGYPVGGYWAYQIQRFTDANGDGIIAPTEVTIGPGRVWVGTPYPTQGAMLTSAWTFGGAFKAALTLDYRAGHTLFNQFAYERCLSGRCRAAVDRDTPLAEQARAVVSIAPTTDYFEKADFLKVRELALTWSPRPRIAAAFGARSVAITLVGRNLLTWTSYSGGDPEAGSYGIIQPGEPRGIADVGGLPVPRTWTLRVDVSY